MQQHEIVINPYNASYCSNLYDGHDPKGPVTRNKQIDTNKFFDKIKDLYSELGQGILPMNCRFSKKFESGKSLYVMEELPQLRTIFLNYDMSMIVETLKASGDLKKFGYENWAKTNSPPYKFYLAFPYILYLIVINERDQFSNMKVFTRVTPISTFADYMCKIPLMNIDESQKVCTGSIKEVRHERKQNITYIIKAIIESFWNNVFNRDYIFNVQKYSNIPYVCDYLTWQYYSKEDPMFIYNVEWIPHNKTLGEEINAITASHSFAPDQKSDISFANLVNTVFYKATKTDKIDKKQNSFIYDDVSDSINIERIPIFVNDSFKIKNKRYFVYSFMCSSGSSTLTYVKLKGPDDKIIKFKLTAKMQSLLRQKIMEERFIQTTTLPSGITVGQGSIIEYRTKIGSKYYNKVTFMRYGVDGKIEARMGSSFHILENMKEIKIIDSKNIVVKGTPLEVNKTYIMLGFSSSTYHQFSRTPICTGKPIKFLGIDVDPSGHLLAFFNDSRNHKIQINIPDLDKKLLFDTELESSISNICRLGTCMIYYDGIKTVGKKEFFISSYDAIKYPTFSEVMDQVLEDTSHLFIESFDMNLSFKIGDKVVVSNWGVPEEMLKVKTITGFNKTCNNLNVILVDKHGNETLHTYLYDSDFVVNIRTGTLRHITNEYNGIVSGTKIIASKGKVTNFPKKDVNIIIGFLTDTGGEVPLALCSNGLTLWADELTENFELISMSNPKWKSSKHVNIMSELKIKYQSGDLTTIPYLGAIKQNLLAVSPYGKLYCHNLVGTEALYPGCHGEASAALKRVTQRIGFVSPRYSQQQLSTQRLIGAYPNFHGMYTFNPKLSTKYYVDQRRILNVSDLPV